MSSNANGFFQKPTYIQRNIRWITPLLLVLMLAITPILIETLNTAQANYTPPAGVFIFGVGLVGFFAARTDTISGRIVSFSGIAAAILGVVWLLFLK